MLKLYCRFRQTPDSKGVLIPVRVDRGATAQQLINAVRDKIVKKSVPVELPEVASWHSSPLTSPSFALALLEKKHCNIFSTCPSSIAAGDECQPDAKTLEPSSRWRGVVRMLSSVDWLLAMVAL